MHRNLSDDVLNIIEGCKAGDRNSQFKLYKLLASKLLYKGMRYIKTKHEAEDCLQETFVKIFNNINSFKGESTIESWATRIMINTVLTKMRSSMKHNQHFDIEAARYIPGQHAGNKNEYDELLGLLNCLPDIHRSVFNMYEMEGFTHKEIAGLLEINESTSRSYLSRAKEMLKKQHHFLNNYYNEKNLS